MKMLIAEIKYNWPNPIWDPTRRLELVIPDNRYQASYWHHTDHEKVCRVSRIETAQRLLKEMNEACNEGNAVLVAIDDAAAARLERM